MLRCVSPMLYVTGSAQLTTAANSAMVHRAASLRMNQLRVLFCGYPSKKVFNDVPASPPTPSEKCYNFAHV